MAILAKLWKVVKWGVVILLMLFFGLFLAALLLTPSPHIAVGKDGTSVSLLGVCDGFEEDCWDSRVNNFSVNTGFNGDLIIDAVSHGSCGDLVPIEPYAEIENETVTLHTRWHLKEGGYWIASPCAKMLRFRVPRAAKVKNPKIKLVFDK